MLLYNKVVVPRMLRQKGGYVAGGCGRKDGGVARGGSSIQLSTSTES